MKRKGINAEEDGIIKYRFTPAAFTCYSDFDSFPGGKISAAHAADFKKSAADTISKLVSNLVSSSVGRYLGLTTLPPSFISIKHAYPLT